MHKILSPLIFFLLLTNFGHSQDSLSHIANKTPQDTSSISAYLSLSQNYIYADHDTSYSYAKSGLMIAEKLKDNYWKGRCYYQMGYVGLMFGHFKESVDDYSKAIDQLDTVMPGKYWIAKSENGMANSQRKLGREKEATDNYLAAKKIFEQLGDKKGIAGTYNNLGIIFMFAGQNQKALEYYRIARKMNTEINNQPWLAKNFSNMGTAFFNLAMYDSAEIYFKEAMRVDLLVGAISDWPQDASNLGNVYTLKKDYKKADEQFLSALAFCRKNAGEANLSFVMCNYAGLLMETGDMVKAKALLDSAEIICTKYSDFEYLLGVYKAYTVFYEKTGDYKNAYHYYELYATKKDSITTLDTKNQMDQMEESLREAKLNQKNEALQQSGALQDAQLNQSRIISYAAISGIILLLALAYTLYKRNQLKKKANELLQGRNNEINDQKAIIENKNREMVDSINYASRIQSAILPPVEKINEIFPQSFLFFRPRDIVSGDFYWFAEKNGNKIIAAADCTGHGVPGALMSMIGNAFLNEIVNEHGITKPSEILGELRRLVIHALKQKGEMGEQRDGMDISLLSFSADGKIEWAGANNPLWIVRGKACIEMDPDRRPIGFFKGQGLPFTNVNVETQKGDMLYIFTDGYADQFGGPKQKKMMAKNFREMLIGLSSLSLEEQKKKLAENFDGWKGKLEQIDDVCVIGIRI